MTRMGDTSFPDLAKAIGARVRARRESLGLTQKQVADAAHVSRTYITNVESGLILPTIPRLVRIAAGLRVGAASCLPPVSKARKLSQEPSR